MAKNGYVRESTCNARYNALHEDVIEIKTNHLPHIEKKVDNLIKIMIGIAGGIIILLAEVIMQGGL